MKNANKKSQYQQQNRKTNNEIKTSGFSKNRKEKIISVIIVFCVPVALYLQTLSFSFTNFDDNILIKENITFLNDLHNAPHTFLKGTFIVKNNSFDFYRPLQTLSYMVDIFLSGGNNSWMYHLTNVLLSGLIACLLFLLFLKFLIPLKFALLSTLVYCAHPLFVSNVAWIPARGDLQLMFFSLLSFLFFIEFIQKKKIVYFFLHWIAFTVALFCKETAAVLPLLFVIYYFTFRSEKHFEKKYFLNIIFYAVSVIFWFWIRAYAIRDFSDHGEVFNVFNKNNEIGLMPVLLNLRTIPESLANFFIPFDIAPIPNFSLLKTAVGLLIITLIGILFFKNKERSKKEKIFCLSWFLILLFPSMIYKHSLIDYLQHRFFLPLAGIMLFVLFIFPLKWIKNTWLIVVVFLVLSCITFIKSRSYSDPINFYNSAISQNPNSAIAYYNRGVEFDNMGKHDKAFNDFNNAINLNPDYAEAYNNRGLIYENQGLHEKAINDYSKTIELFPDLAQAYYNRGLTYNTQKLYVKAINDFSKFIELKPDYADAYYNRGTIYINQGLYDKAINDFSKTIELKSDYIEAYNYRGIAYNHQGLYDKAINDLTKSIELKPDYADAYNNRGAMYLNKKLYDYACRDFKKAEELGSKDAKNNFSKFCK